MDIAKMSMNMSAAQLHQQVSMAVLDMTMETATEMAQDMTEMMAAAAESVAAVAPATGHIDMLV